MRTFTDEEYAQAALENYQVAHEAADQAQQVADEAWETYAIIADIDLPCSVAAYRSYGQKQKEFEQAIEELFDSYARDARIDTSREKHYPRQRWHFSELTAEGAYCYWEEPWCEGDRFYYTMPWGYIMERSHCLAERKEADEAEARAIELQRQNQLRTNDERQRERDLADIKRLAAKYPDLIQETT